MSIIKPALVIFYDHFYPAYKAGGPIQSITNLVLNLQDTYNLSIICSAYDLNENHILEDQFFRSYAYSNQFEFVAVLLEHFFENPLALREKHPELFHNTLRMLNYNVKYI